MEAGRGRDFDSSGLTAHYFFDDVSRPAGVWALAIYTDEALDKMAAYEAAEQTRNQEGF